MAINLDVIVFGSCIMDFISYVPRLPQVGETIHGTRFTTGFGGKGGNQCVAAARLGSQCAMIAKLGQDSWGQAYREHLQKENIDITHLSLIENQSTGIAQINVSESDGANHIVITVGANNSLDTKNAIDAVELMARAKVLVCQLETPIDATISALKHFSGVSILNAAPAPLNTSSDLLKLPTIFCVNESEATLITGMSVVNITKAKEAICLLQEKGANIVIITLGKDGAVFSEKSSSGYFHLNIDPVTACVDTTGAGDAFIGALAHLISKLGFTEYPIGQLIGGACEIASITVGLLGTQTSFPRMSNFEDQVLNKKYNIKAI
ncbi:Ribokinase [Sergentomyia squamirostris]